MMMMLMMITIMITIMIMVNDQDDGGGGSSRGRRRTMARRGCSSSGGDGHEHHRCRHQLLGCFQASSGVSSSLLPSSPQGLRDNSRGTHPHVSRLLSTASEAEMSSCSKHRCDHSKLLSYPDPRNIVLVGWSFSRTWPVLSGGLPIALGLASSSEALLGETVLQSGRLNLRGPTDHLTYGSYMLVLGPSSRRILEAKACRIPIFTLWDMVLVVLESYEAWLLFLATTICTLMSFPKKT